MADGTNIEWADATWNVITGCEICSPGCRLCYAMKLAGTRMKSHPSRAGLTQPSKNGPIWNGEIRFNEEWLDQPLRWTKPRDIFVVAHGDLFYRAVTEEMIEKVFAVMALCPQHRFQVLTKRAARMRAYTTQAWRYESIYNAMGRLGRDGVTEPHPYRKRIPNGMPWPLPNVWLGFSAEDQRHFDERWPHMEELARQGWNIWCSAEPLIGPIDARTALANGLKGVVAGGMSKPRGTPKYVVADPCHPAWPRGLRDQCAAAGAAFHFKQWGDWAPHKPVPGGDLGGDVRAGRVRIVHPTGQSDVEVAEANGGRSTIPGSCYMARVGKKAAGARLDGREHREFPA